MPYCMNKSLFAALLSLTASVGFSQKSAPAKLQAFKIEGTFRNFNGNKVYIHHRWDGKEMTDSAKVQAGKFSMQAKCAEPTLFWVTTSMDLKDPNSFSFFPDAGLSKLNLIGDSLPFSTAEAGKNQADYLQYRVFINELVAIQAKLNQDYAVASQKGDMAAQQGVQMAYQDLNARYITGVKAFVKEHPASLVSAFVVYNDFTNPAIAIDEVEAALATLDASLSQSNYYTTVQKKIEDRRGTTVGYKATNFSQAAPDGKMVKLSDFKGQYVLIDFWASWCRPCRMENPNVVAAYNKFKDKGFTVLGVSMDSNKEPWLQAIKQDNLTWTQVSDLKGWGNEVGRLYGVQGIPQNFLVDKDGKIIAKDLRGAALEEKLAEVLK